MRRIIETMLILLLACIPLGGIRGAADNVPVLITGIITALLSLFSPIRRMELAVAGLYLILWFLFPELSAMAPLAAYGLFQRNPWLVLGPFLSTLSPFQPALLLILGLAVWMSWQEQEARKQSLKYTSMRDGFVQNEMLQQRIRREEELNHEKNLEIAILKERNRISREIHDSVGHTISAAILQLEALKISAEEKQKERLTRITDAMTRGMGEIRASLHNLQSESISLKGELEALTEPMQESYKISTTMQMDEDVPLAVKQTVRNLLREALTNIRRHSDATEIRIVLRELPKHYTAGVKDNGSRIERSQGLGLSSQEEVARSLGGVFTSGWSDGFFVHMTIPKEENGSQKKTQP